MSATPTGLRCEWLDKPTCNVAYVVHTYPAVSHAFVEREVRGVRAAGGRVTTISIHAALASDVLSRQDRAEAAATFAVLPTNLRKVVLGHGRALRHSPSAWWRTLVFALSQAPPGLRARLWQVFYFAEAMLVWGRAQETGAHHLHAHLTNVASDTAWLAATFGALSDPGGGWRWSLTVHGPTEFYAVEQFNLKRKIEAADLVICISDFCRSQLMSLSDPATWPKLRVVHCGADLDRYHRGPDPNPTVDEPTLPEPAAMAPLRVVCVGRLVPEKGQAVLLDAVAKTDAEGCQVEVTFVGGGPERAHLERLARRLGVDARVRFTGPVGQDDLPGLLRQADVFCLPSFAEGVPVVLMEAMASEVPVVTTTIAGIPELVHDGCDGLLVPPGRADALAEALRMLADDDALRSKLGRAGRATVEGAFDAARNADELAALFAELERRDT